MSVFEFNLFLVPLAGLAIVFGLGLAIYQRFAGDKLKSEGYALSSAGDIARWGLLFLLEYASIVAALTTIFAWIDKAIADVVVVDAYTRFDLTSVRYAISVLFVVTPLALALSWWTSSMTFKKPELFKTLARKANLWTGLVAGGALLVVTLIATVSNYLSGEMTSRFLVKATMLIALGITIVFLRLSRLRYPESRSGARLAWFSGVFAMIIAIVFGFMVIGSPAKARMQKLDDVRTQHLWNIEQSVVDYYRKNRVLPATLADLSDRGPLPADPETGKNYVYDVAMVKQSAPGGIVAFHLCATFAAPSREVPPGAAVNDTQPLVLQGPWEGSVAWRHSAGQYCFERIIDPKDVPMMNTPEPQAMPMK